ncbi:MAG: hypothetical protein FJ040_06030 [Chloroflexi bacterium]|nr:hypothetical protein [Chloroflexota bacterium]
MRYGSSRLAITQQPTNGLRLYAHCMAAVHAQHGVVRIPHTYAHAYDPITRQLITQVINDHALRLVIHAPIIPPSTMQDTLERCAQLLSDIASHDGVIICHVPAARTNDEWQWMASLPASITRYLAVEHTLQPIDALLSAAEEFTIPVVFDWLHYHMLAPWPYAPVDVALKCCATWGSQRPLIHLSTPDTADYGNQHRHINGRHAAYLDWVTHMYFLGQLSERRAPTCDIEVEADAGSKALAHFLAQCRRHGPPQWHHLWA